MAFLASAQHSCRVATSWRQTCFKRTYVPGLGEERGARVGQFLRGGDLGPGNDVRHDDLRVARDDGTVLVTFCALRAATVLARNCCADFGWAFFSSGDSHWDDGTDDGTMTLG